MTQEFRQKGPEYPCVTRACVRSSRVFLCVYVVTCTARARARVCTCGTLKCVVLSRVGVPFFRWHGRYLLVNIGTGVSMLLVEGEGSFRRVGGTALGGGTFFGLVTLLTGCATFQDAIDMALRGNHMNVDLLVRDIYGGDYDKFKLRGTVIASSFGKMLRESSRSKANPADLALATLQMISMNIGMLAHLHAEANKATSTLFAGNFLQKNPFARRTLVRRACGHACRRACVRACRRVGRPACMRVHMRA
jgi:hypothetical protein